MGPCLPCALSRQAGGDYTAVIEMPDAPAEQKAQACSNRAWRRFVEGRPREAIDDLQHAVSLDPKNVNANANLAVALLADGQSDAALTAYGTTLAMAHAENLAEMTADLEVALERYGPLPAADRVRARIETRRKSLECGTGAQA